MGTKLEALQAKKEKLQADLKETIEKLEAQEKSETEFEALASKMVVVKTAVEKEVGDVIGAILGLEGVALPEGKVLVVTYRNGAVEAAILDEKMPRKSGNGGGAKSGNGGAKGITLADGTKTSWAELCRNEGLDYGVGSAHAYFYRYARVGHDKVPHICEVDSKTYAAG